MKRTLYIVEPVKEKLGIRSAGGAAGSGTSNTSETFGPGVWGEDLSSAEAPAAHCDRDTGSKTTKIVGKWLSTVAFVVLVLQGSIATVQLLSSTPPYQEGILPSR